ncbi:MAG: DUF3685 domain-containing protein [Nodosilinea sp.]
MTRPTLNLLLVDADPLFRLGLRTWLEQVAGYQVVGEADQAQEALALIRSYLQPMPPGLEETRSPPSSLEPSLDLVILGVGAALERGPEDREPLPGLQLCGQIKQEFPTLPVLVLSPRTEPVLEAAVRQLGADGFASRSIAVADLEGLIQRLTRPPDRPGQPAPGLSPGAQSWVGLRARLRQSSLEQIDAVMAAIAREQGQRHRDLWSAAILAGRYRELRAARWLVKRILATPTDPVTDRPSSDQPVSTWQPSRALPRGDLPLPLVKPESEASPLATPALTDQVFEGVFSKLQGNLENRSKLPLETDILRTDKKHELFYLALRKFEEILDNLRRAEVLPGQLTDKAPQLLVDLWESTLMEFLGPYYSLTVDHLEQPVVPTLMAEVEVVRHSILSTIPLVPMVLEHLLFQAPLLVDGVPYPASHPEAIGRSQLLLEHLLIQVANGVMQPLLNCFADVEAVKRKLYHRRLITSRDIERFRNDLSWRYRWDRLIHEPKSIFESQYRLFSFTDEGIQTQTIYAPRREELEQLGGAQRAVTLVIEAKDAIAPPLGRAISLLGSSLVYLLSDVIGRGIGLIGRGILRGIGNRVYRN